MAVLELGLCTFTARGLCSDPGEPRSHKSQGMARKQTKPRKLNKIKNCSYPRICMAYFQFSSVPQLCPTLCDPMNRSTPGLPVITNSRSSLRLTSIESVMPSSHLILCCPLLLLPPIPPSIRVFSNESTLGMRWPKYWSFSFSIILNEP